MGSVDIVLPSRDSARIARTFILTLQRYELFPKLPNFFARKFGTIQFPSYICKVKHTLTKIRIMYNPIKQ